MRDAVNVGIRTAKHETQAEKTTGELAAKLNAGEKNWEKESVLQAQARQHANVRFCFSQHPQ